MNFQKQGKTGTHGVRGRLSFNDASPTRRDLKAPGRDPSPAPTRSFAYQAVGLRF